MERIHIVDLKEKINLIMKEIGFPSSVCFTFIDSFIIRGERFSLFDYEIIKENDIIKFIIKSYNNDFVEDNYEIIFVPYNKKGIINIFLNDSSSKKSYNGVEQKKVILEYNDNAFNNEPGYIITISSGSSSFCNNSFLDVSYTYVKIFDKNGIEVYCEKITNNFFPRESEYGIKKYRCNRVPFSTSQMVTFREGVDKSVSYYQEIDFTGDIVKKETFYYHLKGDYGYSFMKIDFAMTKEEYDKIGNYSDEELGCLIGNDEYRDVLFNKYRISNDSCKKLVL